VSDKLRRKINDRMDQLQCFMETNEHLKNPLLVTMHLESVSKFWSVLSEEDKDYIHGCQHAIEDQLYWKVDE